VLSKPIPDLGEEEFSSFPSSRPAPNRESISAQRTTGAMLVSRLWEETSCSGIELFSLPYYRRAKADPEEMVRMLDCICTQ